MAYEKQTWACGDTITADKMNHIEEGIENAGGGGSVLEVGVDSNNTLDKTWQEIYDAFPNVAIVEASDRAKIAPLMVAELASNYDVIVFLPTGQPGAFEANSADGYPVLRSNS